MTAPGVMHVSPIAGSPAQQRILSLLREHGSIGATTREIVELANVCAVSAWMHALKVNGLEYRKVWEGVNKNGANVVRYFIVADRTGWADPSIPVAEQWASNILKRVNAEPLRINQVPFVASRYEITLDDYSSPAPRRRGA